mmetsp:Transcript_116047/g.333280  ORF Transcript_116047/g.333280 Transcript_116047/m.333280 type:complete len:190 (-) Transcript_116047:203-772(-)
MPMSDSSDAQRPAADLTAESLRLASGDSDDSGPEELWLRRLDLLPPASQCCPWADLDSTIDFIIARRSPSPSEVDRRRRPSASCCNQRSGGLCGQRPTAAYEMKPTCAAFSDMSGAATDFRSSMMTSAWPRTPTTPPTAPMAHGAKVPSPQGTSWEGRRKMYSHLWAMRLRKLAAESAMELERGQAAHH